MRAFIDPKTASTSSTSTSSSSFIGEQNTPVPRCVNCGARNMRRHSWPIEMWGLTRSRHRLVDLATRDSREPRLTGYGTHSKERDSRQLWVLGNFEIQSTRAWSSALSSSMSLSMRSRTHNCLRRENSLFY